MRKQDSSELDELVGFLDSFMDNMNTEENPTCCQLTALDVITSIIFRRVRHYRTLKYSRGLCMGYKSWK